MFFCICSTHPTYHAHTHIAVKLICFYCCLNLSQYCSDIRKVYFSIVTCLLYNIPPITQLLTIDKDNLTQNIELNMILSIDYYYYFFFLFLQTKNGPLWSCRNCIHSRGEPVVKPTNCQNDGLLSVFFIGEIPWQKQSDIKDT